MIQSIIKRDGRVVLYDQSKIAAAILRALEVSGDGNAADAAAMERRGGAAVPRCAFGDSYVCADPMGELWLRLREHFVGASDGESAHGDAGLLGGGTPAGAAGHCAGIVLGRRSKEKPQLTDEHEKDR